MGAAAFKGADAAGDRKHLTVLLVGQLCRDERTALFGCLHHNGPEAHAADDAIAGRKVMGLWFGL